MGNSIVLYSILAAMDTVDIISIMVVRESLEDADPDP